MKTRARLAQNLTLETKAYGYTLTIWSAGALLSNVYSTPTRPAIAVFLVSSLLAFGALTAVAFGEMFTETEAEDQQELTTASMIHFVATGGAFCVNYAIIAVAPAVGVNEIAVFALVGFQSTITYNLFLLLEERLVRVIAWALKGAEAPAGQ